MGGGRLVNLQHPFLLIGALPGMTD